MGIVIEMAGNTASLSSLIGLVSVAAGTGWAKMSAIKGKPRFIVIEISASPILGRMTFTACITQISFMDVAVFMAGPAINLKILEFKQV